MVAGSADGLDQIIKQVDKLVDVLRIDHTNDGSVVKEMGLIAGGSSDARSGVQIAEHYAKTIDLTDQSMIIQVVGNPDKIDSLEK